MIEYRLNDMTCGHCEKAVRGAIGALDPLAGVDIDLPSQRVRIDSQLLSAEDLVAALTDAGYPPASG